MRDVVREIALHVGAAAQPTKITVRRPTHFDEVVVSTIAAARSPFVEPLNLPSNLGQARQFVRSTLRMLETRLSKPLEISGPFLDARPASLNNIAHLMCGTIPTAIYARESLGCPVTVITHSIAPSFQELARQFHIPVVITNKTVVGQKVQVSVTRNLQLYELEGVFDCAATTLLPSQYGEFRFPPGPVGDRVFLARRGARSLVNQSEVEAVLSGFGYTQVYLEDYEIHEQLAIATNAKHVVAIHGAAMGYLVANPVLSSIVELFPQHTHHEWFAMQFDKGVEYHALVQEFDETIPPLGYGEILKYNNGRVHANADSLRGALSSIHGAQAN